jgi:hypothetical protein
LFVVCFFKDDTGGKVQSETAFSLWEKNKTTMKNEVKELLGDIPLEIDNRVTLIHLDTIRFARLKTHEYKAVSQLFSARLLLDHDSQLVKFLKAYDIYKHAVVALEECENVTKINFPHLHTRNTQTGLSSSSKENIRMCLKKSERNILIFVVRLHYAITVCNAFRVAPERRDLVAIRFNFDTFPELEAVLMELELDRECAVKCTNRKKMTRVKLESELMDKD